jgi:spermidine/putrescine transport system permease protein
MSSERIGAAFRDRFTGPWRKPYGLALITWLYLIWALIPVLIAIQFSFNNGRSRSNWQGFSLRWWNGATGSLLHDPELWTAMRNSVVLAIVTMLIATPLGVALAIGLTRWRGVGRRPANMLMLIPLVTPELVLGSALFLAFTRLYDSVGIEPVADALDGLPLIDGLVNRVGTITLAQVLGHVTLNLSYVVVIVRGRLLSIPHDIEEAARDLGATPMQALRTVLVPLLGPAIFASLMIVFATSIDDFVISAFLQGDVTSETVPVRIYGGVRSTPTPALNALATAMLALSFVAIVLAAVVPRWLRRGEPSTGSAVTDFAAMEL